MRNIRFGKVRFQSCFPPREKLRQSRFPLLPVRVMRTWRVWRQRESRTVRNYSCQTPFSCELASFPFAPLLIVYGSMTREGRGMDGVIWDKREPKSG